MVVETVSTAPAGLVKGGIHGGKRTHEDFTGV
jgi:hypothetical protein